jgi:hypothetical protein
VWVSLGGCDCGLPLALLQVEFRVPLASYKPHTAAAQSLSGDAELAALSHVAFVFLLEDEGK